MNGTASQPRCVAYFSMEIALDPAMPTYAGGLGVLAGDALRAAADLRVPMVGVSLLQRHGYFRQTLDAHGGQSETPEAWAPEEHLERLPLAAAVTVEGRIVHLRAWRYVVGGLGAASVPVYLLDADLPENDPLDRPLTDDLYGGDERYRLRQEALLGLGGIAMLRALGYRDVAAYHLNEGHSALLAVALLHEQLAGRPLREASIDDIEAVRERCVFTTHTPVPAGHDQFPLPLVRQVLGDEVVALLQITRCCPAGVLNMTHLALRFSRYVNGVAMRHGEVAQGMFPNYPIHSITNGVHAATWTTAPFQRLFDGQIPGWRLQNFNLRYAIKIPLHEIRRAHVEAKSALLAEVARRTATVLAPGVLTVGFARRAATYKRADLLFTDVERLRRIAHVVGPLQLVYAGKAHPRDEAGKAVIRRVYDAAHALHDSVPIVYLENYEMDLARTICGGVDLWLNTPQRPEEASGTSGMKAALNGVPSLSVLDGWWIEGHAEGVTGWSIGTEWSGPADPAADARALLDQLERTILPTFYGRPDVYAAVMRSAIALNGSFFNAERMLMQYAAGAYRL